MALIFFTACSRSPFSDNANNSYPSNSMKLTSSAFSPNENIPPQYTCDGQNTNPPLEVDGIPDGAKSLVLIMDDPDAPRGTWLHWTVWSIDPAVKSLEENSVPKNSVEGTTSFGSIGYGGPCPPSGIHRYFFKLYALDVMLELSQGTQLDVLLKAMEGHILEYTELIGLYGRSR